jgi:alkylation response protein AidB-like acyl-CoA dehydrogenase
MAEPAQRMRRWEAARVPDLPLPGGGATAARHRALADLGCRDLSLARIAEAHTDAVAILAEAGRRPRDGALYGVWASDGPQSRVSAHGQPDGRWRLDGCKHFCSGASFVSDALITAHAAQGLLLFEVSLEHPGVTVLPSTWASPALADTATAPIALSGVVLDGAACIGIPNWYLERPGFWHGAVGPAACWAGGARSLIDAATRQNRRDAHSQAHLGALRAIAWGLEATLDTAGAEIDADPADRKRQARARALMVRHLVERWCTEVLDRFGLATGPGLLCFDAHVAQQHMGLGVYIRQCHGERDLVSIAGAV